MLGSMAVSGLLLTPPPLAEEAYSTHWPVESGPEGSVAPAAAGNWGNSQGSPAAGATKSLAVVPGLPGYNTSSLVLAPVCTVLPEPYT